MHLDNMLKTMDLDFFGQENHRIGFDEVIKNLDNQYIHLMLEQMKKHSILIFLLLITYHYTNFLII